MSRTAARAGAVGTLVLLAFLVLGPSLWSRGYVLVGDMTFVPDQPWKSAWLGLDGSVPRAVPADAVVSVLSHVVPGDLLQKAILLGILLGAGMGMFRLVGRISSGISTTPRLAGAVLYLWNPYVFERLAIGHWGLLVGYAALPWVVGIAIDVRRGAPGALARMVVLLGVAAVGSPTGGLVAALVALVVTADRADRRAVVVVAVSAVLVNLPWLAPSLVGDALTSDSSGVGAFAARADTPFGAWVSLLTFGGIWKAAAAPAERADHLLVGASLLLVLVSLGALVTRRVAVRGRLGALAVVGLLLAGVPATGSGQRMVSDLVAAVPGLGLWRDSQKWLMPFVLVACVGFALLVDIAGRRMRSQGLGAVTVLVALLPLVLLPSMGWGLAGRYGTADYPAEWATVRTVLERQDGTPRTAVLPWSAYQRLPWNDRRAALDPALRYFPGQVVTNGDLVVAGGVTVKGEDRRTDVIARALTSGDQLQAALESLGIRYLLVEKTASGATLSHLPAGEVLHDGPELLLLDLGHPTRSTRTQHPGLVLTGDALAAVTMLGAAVAIVRRRRGRTIGYDPRGSSNDADTGQGAGTADDR